MTKTFLIIEARFYEDLAKELVAGATGLLDKHGFAYERLSVPGVLEIPAALAMVADSSQSGRFAGYVLLGCVIRGETSHYDIVAVESARAIIDLAVRLRLAVGNGILTVESAAQAWARARVNEKNKGAAAAAAAIAMAEHRDRLGLAHV